MLRGIYTAASGLNVQQAGLDVAGNNIANFQTPGFKQDRLSAGSFPAVLLIRLEREAQPAPVGQTCCGVQVSSIETSFEQGPLENTGNLRDVALEGDGFLVAATPDGERYFRTGTLFVDQEGYLVTSGGHQVLGENGPVRIEGGEFKIFADGTVVSGQNPVDRLRVVTFQDQNALVKEGAGYFSAPGIQPDPAAAAKVRQGVLEGSNVELTDEMVRLIEGVRAYQLCQRALRTHDALLDRAVNQVGKTD